MMLRHRSSLFAGGLAILLVVAFVPRQLDANHSWGGYHWDGSALPVDVDVADNLSNDWANHLVGAVADWNNPTGGATQAINLNIVPGSNNPATCDPTLGRIEVCNDNYGDTGWLGIAQVWVYRGKDKHIAQATTLLNDWYYAQPFYDTWAWRRAVTCQEIAHDFGLDHQDEDFYNYNLGTCMDYSANPAGGVYGNFDYGPANTAPNQHDHDQNAETYAHIGGGGGGGGNRGGGGGGGGGGGRGNNKSDAFPDLPEQGLQRVPIDSPAAWGQLIRDSGRAAVYELDLGNGFTLFTFVTWAA